MDSINLKITVDKMKNVLTELNYYVAHQIEIPYGTALILNNGVRVTVYNKGTFLVQGKQADEKAVIEGIKQYLNREVTSEKSKSCDTKYCPSCGRKLGADND